MEQLTIVDNALYGQLLAVSQVVNLICSLQKSQLN